MSGHCNGKVKSIPKADRGIGKCVSQVVLKCLKNSYSLALVSRLLTTVRKITHPVRPSLDWELVNRLPKIHTLCWLPAVWRDA